MENLFTIFIIVIFTIFIILNRKEIVSLCFALCVFFIVVIVFYRKYEDFNFSFLLNFVIFITAYLYPPILLLFRPFVSHTY